MMNLASKILGLGCGAIGANDCTEDTAAHVVAIALEAGVRLFDAAPSYGYAEERLGRYLKPRRKEIWLSTKLGYGVPGVDEWTGPCITAGIELALRRLHTDYLDIALLHSCSREVLLRDDIRWAFERAKREGKVRFYGYSGEGSALQAALSVPEFDVLMASLNLCDQRSIDEVLPQLRGRLFLAKRPLANAPWRYPERPVGHYVETYWERWQAMALPDFGLDPSELALRFSAWHTGVANIVIGTANPSHLLQAVEWVSHGPLPGEVTSIIRTTFRNHDTHWTGQI